MEGEESKKLENLDAKLHAQGFRQKIPHHDLKEARDDTDDVPHEWKEEPVRKKKLSFLAKALITAGLLLLLTVAVALFMWSQDLSAVDADKIVITASLSDEIVSGEIFNADITIRNENKQMLINPVLLLDYDEGLRNADGEERERIEIGDIGPEETYRLTVQVIALTAVGEERELNFTLQYQIPDSSSEFIKEFREVVVVSQSPYDIELNIPESISTSKSVSGDVIVQAANLSGENTFELEVNLPRGLLLIDEVEGQTSQEESFLITLSPTQSNVSIPLTLSTTESSPRDATITILLKNREGLVVAEADKSIAIVAAPLSLRAETSNDALPEQPLRIMLNFKNTTNSNLTNTRINGSLSGAYDKNRVKVDSGFFNQGAQTLEFNPQTLAALEELSSGEEVRASLVVYPTSGQGGSINLSLEATGQKLQSSIERSVLGSLTKSFPVLTPIQVSGSTYYRAGEITNRGPLPPEVGQETTYTVSFDVSADGVYEPQELRATVPDYVEILNPPTEVVIDDGNLVWALSSTAGSQSQTFQVEITPREDQVGSPAPLLENIILVAEKGTGNSKESFEFAYPPLTTDLAFDIAYDPDEANVIQP